ncbi:MAG: alpha-2-macroglobulin family protein, partial [Bacteroidota bacterium]
VKEVAYFTVIDRKGKEMPFATIDWYNVLQGQGEPGTKAELLVGSSEKLSVLYEWEKDNKIISKQWLLMEKGQKLLEIPLTEAYRGNIGVHYTFVHHNRLYKHQSTIVVPYTNKQLDVTFETFRNKLLPGQKEEWKIRIRGKKGEKVAAEMVATLYDASLDAFRANQFNFNIYNSCYASLDWSSLAGFKTTEATIYQNSWNHSVSGASYSYDQLNWFEYGIYYYQQYFGTRGGVARKSVSAPGKAKKEAAGMEEEREEMKEMDAMPVAAAPAMMEAAPAQDGKKKVENQQAEKPKPKPEEPVKVRTNFNETAFFYPHLQTDANGDVLVAFTIPEALTRWKMLGFAHTQDLQYGLATNTLVTQKELMITANAPRFFREGDTIAFTAKVNNLSEADLNGTAQLLLFDALTMQPVDGVFGNRQGTKPFTVKKGQSAGVSWDLVIPEGVEAVTYRVVAKAGTHSDGEEKPVPILTNRMLVTESLPLPIRGNQHKTFQLDKLVHNQSTTLRNHQLTLEFTANPAWYAVQALPYLMEYPYECAEQTFSRFYANSMASHIANANPKIKRVFDSWRSTEKDSKALLSNLEKNQELKSLLLEETPWVMNAKNESERKKRVALLFDLNRMASEQERALTKLAKMQKYNGGWPWFDGMPENGYITQHIVAGLGHLDHLGVRKIREDATVFQMTKQAISFIDQQLKKQYDELKKLEKKKLIKLSDNHLGYAECHYLYARSFFKDIPVASNAQEAFNYFKGQAKTYWLSGNTYQQGMLALALFRWQEKTVPAAIIKSLRERALNSEEMGMYWKSEGGFYWYQAPIETQALMIEVFDEVANDPKAVEEMKVWLLKQKQTQDWRTTKATTEACYALLLKGSDWLTSEGAVEITIGGQVIDPKQMPDVKVEAGTGYFKTSWSGSDIKPAMGTVTLHKKEAGVSWGALYWQYFEQLDKITPHATPLQIKKALFLQKASPTGPVITPINEHTALHPGDLIKVRIELRVDRTMEYVHMKDMRAAGLEPTNVLSGYRYQDGLGYYESTRDAATNFFFDYLPKGTYVFEYPLRVTHEGNFSNGITSIQSMYAPEFSSHSQGIRVKVNK